jgi:hypothetical protein
MKDLIKKVYYLLPNNYSLSDYNLNLAYIFHTEKIYDEVIFDRLKNFCTRFKQISGAKPICTIIPPTNLLLKKEMNSKHISESHFTEKVIELSQISTLGYHGHFYLDNNPEYYNAIQCDNFISKYLTQQFNADIEWFDKNNISHHGIYTGGWWFINEPLLNLLFENNFKYDFTFSHSNYFYNKFSIEIMNKNNIVPGEAFYLTNNTNKNKILCIQNFIGVHGTRFPLDFNRNFIALYKHNKIPPINIGVVNSHDYDLNLEYTLNCIQHLLGKNKVKFHSINEIDSLINRQKAIKLVPV